MMTSMTIVDKVKELTDGMPTRFDPHLLALFQQHADRFAAIYQELPDK